MSDQPKEQPVESLIIIRFAEPNSTILEVKYQNVSPLQSRIAAWILERDAEHTLDDALETRKQQVQPSPPKLAVPAGYGGIIPT